MILLDGQSLTPKIKFTPEKMSLALQEREGSASMTLGPEHPDLTVGDWLQDDTEPGKGIVWRVKSIEEDYLTETRTVTLEHIIASLKDTIIFGEVKSENMGGSESGVAAKQAIDYALSKQSIWRLGTLDYPAYLPYSFNGDTVYEALSTVSDTLADCEWTYNLKSLPFKINIVKQATETVCELRKGRNLQTIKKSIDRSRMYTRFYPVGENDLHINGDYLEKNTNKYGVISKTETDQGFGAESLLRAWAQDKLERHCEPTVTITVSGMELSQATGESLDHLGIGYVCQVPMPELKTTIKERITKLQWSDKIKDPETCTITMANNHEDVATLWRSETSSSSKSSRTSAKKAGEDHAWFVDTEDHVGMVAEAVAGPGADKDWSRVSEIFVDGTGIHQRVTLTENEIVTHEARIEVSEKKISQEVVDRSEQGKELRSAITQEANRISLVVEGTGKDAKIKPAQIVTAINDSGSSVLLSADKIVLDGKTSVSSLLTGKARISNLVVNDLNAYNLGVQAQSGMGFISVASCINTAIVRNNQLELYNMAGKLVATFSKATTLSGKWSGGSYTVTATQQGKKVSQISTSLASLVKYGGVSVSGKNVTQSVRVMYSLGEGQSPAATGFASPVTIDASNVYDNGYDAGYDDGESDGYNAGYPVSNSQVSGSVTGMVAQSAGSSVISGRRGLGSYNKPSVASYLLCTVYVHGASVPCYIELN